MAPIVAGSLIALGVIMATVGLFVSWSEQEVFQEYCYEYSSIDDTCQKVQATLGYYPGEIDVTSVIEHDDNGDRRYESREVVSESVEWDEVSEAVPEISSEADRIRIGNGLLIGSAVTGGFGGLLAFLVPLARPIRWIAVGATILFILAGGIGSGLMLSGVSDVGDIVAREVSGSEPDADEVHQDLVKGATPTAGPFLWFASLASGAGAAIVLALRRPTSPQPRQALRREDYAISRAVIETEPLAKPGVRGPSLRCPKCSSIVNVQSGRLPVCWTCGFGG